MYLDPGFGGMLLQVVVVIIAMGGAILFSLRKKLRDFFLLRLFLRKDNKDIDTNTTTTNHTGDSTADTSNNKSEEPDLIDALEEAKETEAEK